MARPRRFRSDADKIAVVGVRFAELVITDTAGGARVDYGGGTVTLRGVAANALDAGDFIF